MSEDLQAVDVAVGGSSVVTIARPRARARPAVPDEQLAYARMLDSGMKIGLLLITLTFVAYVGGLLTPHVPVADLPHYWSLSVKEYLAATGIRPGWGWILLLGKGDFVNFMGIALLAGVTIPCYVTIARIFFRKGDLVYGWLAVLEVAVLALAASGVLTAGAH